MSHVPSSLRKLSRKTSHKDGLKMKGLRETNDEDFSLFTLFFPRNNMKKKRNQRRKKSFPFAADTKKDFPVCICFLLFSILSRARRRREKRKTNNGARENWFETQKKNLSESGGDFVCVEGKSARNFLLFFLYTKDFCFFFWGNVLMDGKTRWPRLMEIRTLI